MNAEMPPLILCSTARLAHSLRLAHARAQIAAGLTQWQPLETFTLNQWLEQQVQTLMLSGDIPAANAPSRALDTMEERLLWERTIEASLTSDVMKELFDSGGMANAAAEANALMQVWGIQSASLLSSSQTTEETSQFLLWRKAFQKACSQGDWLEPARYFDWQIDQLAKGFGNLPATIPSTIYVAGFDRIDPQQQRLFDALSAHGVKVDRWHIASLPLKELTQVCLPDREAECRAAVAWAANIMRTNPRAQLAIVVPELAVLRERLASLLDDSLHPAAIQATNAEMPRSYDFSLGQPLAAQPLVAVAIALLRLCAGRRRVSQESFSPLLLQHYWSADVTEADARAQFDAKLRRKLPQTISLKRIIRYAEHLTDVPRLAGNLRACTALLDVQPSSCLPSAWVQALQGLLASLGWPGERGLSSHEFQAQQAFQEVLGAISRLDALLGKVTLSDIVQRLAQNCRERIFQPRSLGNPGLQILGLLEAAGSPLDAMWVMGMNDHIWPPPPRPNPLLPAAVQRAVGTPNADSAVQAEFAMAIHQRLLQSAPQIIFSWAEKDADRMLRISPLIAGLPAIKNLSLAATLAEQCLPAGGFQPQVLDDHLAPPIAAGEHVRGGTGLLKAQAICPAWAFYQYRLGARKLESPVDGLDVLERGSLVHAVLERFWLGRDSSILQPDKTDERQLAIDEAVKYAIAELNEKLDQPLPSRLMVLERHRLLRLMEVWLQFEAARQAPFAVEACEREIIQDIEGIEVRLLIDRVDALDDGRLVVIDYKTGAIPDYKNWVEPRMTEPQLPIYAALALAGENVAAICFAAVKRVDQSFSGIAAEAGLLPGVRDLEDKKTREVFTEFPNWQALLQYWQQNIRAIAAEIKAGEAAVRFADEEELKYCEVMPLLRLPERKLQFEHSRDDEVGSIEKLPSPVSGRGVQV